jgi:hypothetical protein
MAAKKKPVMLAGPSLYDRVLGTPYSRGGSGKLTGRGSRLGVFKSGGFRHFGGRA